MALVNIIGCQIKMFRIAHNMTQKELAEKSGISQSHISYYERGAADNEKNDIRIGTLEKIAAALDVKVTDLMFEIAEEDIDYEIEDEFDAANMIISQKTRECYYPPDVRGHQISTLVEFMIYLPLIRQRDIVEIVKRVGGDIIGREDYLSSLISSMVSRIPDSPQKDYADWYFQEIKKIRNKEINEKDEEPMELYHTYLEGIETKYRFYSTIETLKQEYIIDQRDEIYDVLNFFDKSHTSYVGGVALENKLVSKD